MVSMLALGGASSSFTVPRGRTDLLKKTALLKTLNRAAVLLTGKS
jgi:hypothetical protein